MCNKCYNTYINNYNNNCIITGQPSRVELLLMETGRSHWINVDKQPLDLKREHWTLQHAAGGQTGSKCCRRRRLTFQLMMLWSNWLMADSRSERSDWLVLPLVASGPEPIRLQQGVCSVMSGCCHGYGTGTSWLTAVMSSVVSPPLSLVESASLRMKRCR